MVERKLVHLVAQVVTALVLATTSPAAADDPVSSPPAPVAAASSVPASPLPDPCAADRQQVTTLQKLNADMSANNATLQNQVDAQKRQITDLQASLGTASKTVADLQSQLSDAQRDQQAKAAKIADIQGRLGVVETKAQVIGADRDKLNDKKFELQRELTDAKNAGNSAWWAYAKTAADRDRIQKEKEGELKQVTAQLDDRETRLRDVTRTRDTLSTELTDTQAEEDKAKKEAAAKEELLKAEQAKLASLRDHVSKAITWIALFAALALLVAISRFGYDVYRDVRTARLTHAPSLKPNSIGAALAEDYFFHHIVARRLQVAILSAAVLASATGFCVTVVVAVAAHNGSAGLSTIMILVNGLFWKLVAGCAAPVAALVAAYKAMQNKPTDALKLLSELGVNILGSDKA